MHYEALDFLKTEPRANRLVGNESVTSKPKSKRHRFQFSLRTLMIVVTLLCVDCYVAREWRIVAQRREWLERHFDDDYSTNVNKLHDLGDDYLVASGDGTINLPWLREWLRDEPKRLIILRRSAGEDDIAQARQLFPEADIRHR